MYLLFIEEKMSQLIDRSVPLARGFNFGQTPRELPMLNYKMLCVLRFSAYSRVSYNQQFPAIIDLSFYVLLCPINTFISLVLYNMLHQISITLLLF